MNNITVMLKDVYAKRVFLFFIASLLFILSIPSCLYAQSGVGVSIKPAQIEETLDPGASKEYILSVQNLTSATQRYYLFVRNIEGVGPGGVPVFATLGGESTGYELADWLVLSSSSVDIDSGESQSIGFRINVPQDASPGGHFGGVFVSVEPPDMEQLGASVGYQVANIISIRVSGEAVERASIRQFSTDKFLYGSQNVNFNVRIENEGNVLVRPVGMIEITNMLGKKIDVVPFNEEGRAVFPLQSRDYFNINWVGEVAGLGRYEAVLSAVYGEDGAKKTISSTKTFWVLPMNIIGPALAVLLTVLLTVFFFVRVYIKRSLSTLNTGRRLVNRRRNRNSSSALLLLVVLLMVIAIFLISLLLIFA